MKVFTLKHYLHYDITKKYKEQHYQKILPKKYSWLENFVSRCEKWGTVFIISIIYFEADALATDEHISDNVDFLI